MLHDRCEGFQGAVTKLYLLYGILFSCPSYSRGKFWQVKHSVKFGCFIDGDELPVNLTDCLWSKQRKNEFWQGPMFDHKAPDTVSNLAGTYLGS